MKDVPMTSSVMTTFNSNSPHFIKTTNQDWSIKNEEKKTNGVFLTNVSIKNWSVLPSVLVIKEDSPEKKEEKDPVFSSLASI